MNRADIGMIQGRRCARLAAEALQRLRVSREIVGREFQSDEAAQLGVLGLIDQTHAAATKLLDDAVMRDDLADHSCDCLTILRSPSVSSGLHKTGSTRRAVALLLTGLRSIARGVAGWNRKLPLLS
jgi:hypothetical protein